MISLRCLKMYVPITILPAKLGVYILVKETVEAV